MVPNLSCESVPPPKEGVQEKDGALRLELKGGYYLMTSQRKIHLRDGWKAGESKENVESQKAGEVSESRSRECKTVSHAPETLHKMTKVYRWWIWRKDHCFS